MVVAYIPLKPNDFIPKGSLHPCKRTLYCQIQSFVTIYCVEVIIILIIIDHNLQKLRVDFLIPD